MLQSVSAVRACAFPDPGPVPSGSTTAGSVLVGAGDLRYRLTAQGGTEVPSPCETNQNRTRLRFRASSVVRPELRARIGVVHDVNI